MKAMKIQLKKLSVDNSGTSAVEYAILFPFFALMVYATIEFGMYFIKDEITARAVSNLANLIQENPKLPVQSWNAAVQKLGLGLIQFGQNGNYICAQSYASAPASNLTCTSNSYNINPPNGVPLGQPYYIQIGASLQKGNITPVGNFASTTKNIKIAQSSGVIEVGNMQPSTKCNAPGQKLQFNGTSFSCVNGPPTCQAGQAIQWNGNVFSCVDISPPSCSQRWQRLAFSGGSFKCINAAYVLAAGVANPKSNGGNAVGGSYWDQDINYTSWSSGSHKRFTLCERNITFNIPQGMPPGQIIPQGNLLYYGGGGAWNHWTISFLHWSAPSGGGTGRFDICESNGGNWITENDNPSVGAEHISWTISYVPNSVNR